MVIRINEDNADESEIRWKSYAGNTSAVPSLALPGVTHGGSRFNPRLSTLPLFRLTRQKSLPSSVHHLGFINLKASQDWGSLGHGHEKY